MHGRTSEPATVDAPHRRFRTVQPFPEGVVIAGDAALDQILVDEHRQARGMPVVARLRDIAIARDAVEDLVEDLLSFDHKAIRVFVIPDEKSF